MDIAELIGSAFADGQVLTVPWGIDYFSVVVGVLTGALFACDRKLDIIGTVVLGLVTGYGGGIIRDVLLQDKGVYFTSHPDLILLCIVLCVFVFYFRGLFQHLDAMVFFADALSVGLFALAGASKAYACGEGFVLTVILGAITAVGGGAVRDICVGETPGIFQQSNFSAVAAARGGRHRLRVHGGLPALLERVLRLEDPQRGRPHPACGARRGQGEARGVGRVPAGRRPHLGAAAAQALARAEGGWPGRG